MTFDEATHEVKFVAADFERAGSLNYVLALKIVVGAASIFGEAAFDSIIATAAVLST